MAVARAFQQAQNGADAELQSLLASGEVAAGAMRADGLYKGYSLLHAAAGKGHATIVEMLLRAGAPSDVKTPQGKTPKQMALDKGHEAVAALLEAAKSGAAPAVAPPATPSASLADVDTALTASLATLGIGEKALEAEFDAWVTGHVSDAEADRLTDAVAAGGDSAGRCVIMRRLMSEHGGAKATAQTPATAAASPAPASPAPASPAPASPAPASPADHKAEIDRLKRAQDVRREEERRQKAAARAEREAQRQLRHPASVPVDAALPPKQPAAAEHHGDVLATESGPSGGGRYRQTSLDGMYAVRLEPSPPQGAPPPRPQRFELMESVKGQRINTLEGLELYAQVLSPPEQLQTLDFVRRLRELGGEGAL